MRIGLHGVSRLNGLGVDMFDVGSLSGVGLIAQDLKSYLANLPGDMERGSAVTADRLRTILTDDVTSYCRNWPERCGGGESAAVESAVATYASAYQSEYNRVKQNVEAGLILLPGGSSFPATVVPQQTVQNQYTYQAPNALDRTAPQTSSVTTQQSGSALNPPQQTTVVQQTQTQEGSNILAMRPGEGEGTPVLGLENGMWLLVAGGVALFFMLGKGR